MTAPGVLLAHERPHIVRTVRHILQADGFEVVEVPDGQAARAHLDDPKIRAFVLDVGLPKVPGYELAAEIRRRELDRVVILVASVYRRTSYKRRPTRLYGADDYVEVHHLCDQLPRKLRAHLRLGEGRLSGEQQRAGADALRVEGDRRLGEADLRRLATLLVADMVLYNGDRILPARTTAEAQRAVADDLTETARLLEQVGAVEGREGQAQAQTLVRQAFRELMHTMGRAQDDASEALAGPPPGAEEGA